MDKDKLPPAGGAESLCRDRRPTHRANGTCASIRAEPGCTNFNEENGFVATLPPEAPDGAAPFCIVPQGAEFAQGQLPEASPAPFSEHFTGRRSTCQLIAAQSSTSIDVNGEQVAPHTAGEVQFLGEPCPGGRCAVGMSYKLDIDPFELGNFFGGAAFNDLVASGAAIQGAAELDEQGVGQIPAGATLTSGRGTRRDFGIFGSEPDQQTSFKGTNDQPVDVSVDWTNKTCAVNGVLLGASVEDGNSLSVAVSLHGILVNQPPVARAGAAQIVECTSAAGAAVSLDGGASSDPDDNVALAQWQRQSRLGPIVSESLTASLTQPLGAETYILKVMDAFGQIEEDTTVVTVVDSTPPDVTSITAAPEALSPANHKLVPVTVSVAASDSCGGQADCHITAIQSNEPANGGGDGNTSADFMVTGPLTASLRAERSGRGTDRVYTIAVECTDPAGNRIPSPPRSPSPIDPPSRGRRSHHRPRHSTIGRLLLNLKAEWSDGTTPLLFELIELLEQLAALTPRPRINLVLDHGVLAAHSRWRTRAVAYRRDTLAPLGRSCHRVRHGSAARRARRGQPAARRRAARRNWIPS